MTTTVKLLSTYDGFGPGTILDLPDNAATALLAGGIGATTDLTGGVRRFSKVSSAGTVPLGAPAAPLVLSTGQEATIDLPSNYVFVVAGGAGAEATVTPTTADGTVHASLELQANGQLLIGPYKGGASIVVRTLKGPVRTHTVSLAESRALRVVNGVATLGDSLMDQNFYGFGAITSIVDNGDGTATATGTDMKAYQGDVVSIKGHGTPILNQVRTRVTAATITAGKVVSFTYTLTGPYSRSSQSGGTIAVFSERMESDRGMLVHLKARTGARFKILAAFAVGGSTSDDAQFLADAALASGALVIACQIGTNNVYARGFSAAYSIASIKKVIDRIVECGAVPVFFAVPPRSDATNSFALGNNNSAITAALIAPVNRWMKTYLPTVGGHFVDTWAGVGNGLALADFSSPLGWYNTGMAYDGVHYSRLGAMVAAKRAEALARTLFPASGIPSVNPMDVVANTKVYFDNSLLTGTAGTKSVGSGVINGNIPTGLSVTNVTGTQTVECSIFPRTEAADGDNMGNWFRMVITGAGVGSRVRVSISASTAGAAAWAHGDNIEAFAKVRTSSGTTPGTGNPVGFTQPDMQINVSTTTTGTDIGTAMINQGAGAVLNEAMDLVLETPPYPYKWQGAAMHGALGFIRLDMNVFAQAASASITVDICHVNIGAVVPSA